MFQVWFTKTIPKLLKKLWCYSRYKIQMLYYKFQKILFWLLPIAYWAACTMIPNKLVSVLSLFCLSVYIAVLFKYFSTWNVINKRNKGRSIPPLLPHWHWYDLLFPKSMFSMLLFFFIHHGLSETISYPHYSHCILFLNTGNTLLIHFTLGLTLASYRLSSF